MHGHEQILWPDHCVQDTPGAELKPGLPWHRADVIVRKATDPEVDPIEYRFDFGDELQVVPEYVPLDVYGIGKAQAKPKKAASTEARPMKRTTTHC